MGCTIIGTGKALPPLIVRNDDLAQLVETSDEWIVPRTGIHERRIAVQESGVDLGEAAARAALGWDANPALSTSEVTTGTAHKPLEAESIDLIIHVSVTPDVIVPSCAAMLRRRLGLSHAVAFDMNAACSSFIYALSVAESMLSASALAGTQGVARPGLRRALIVSAERLTRIADWTDRNTCVLFGDGAGAVIAEWDAEKPGIRAYCLRNDDDLQNTLTVPAAWDSIVPFQENGVNPALLADGPRALDTHDAGVTSIDEELAVTERVAAGAPRKATFMSGQKVFKFATAAMVDAIKTVLNDTGLTTDDVAVFVPHQANERIIAYAAKKLGVPLERFQLSIGYTGNVSSACIPMALADAYAQGRVKPGDNVVLVAFGGGFTSGALLYQA